MMTEELLSPLNLAKVQFFYIHKITKVVMFSKYQKFVLTAFEIVFSYFKGFNNSQTLRILKFILCFCQNYFT